MQNEEKDVSEIDNIIAHFSYQDYQRKVWSLSKKDRDRVRTGRKQISYSLSARTEEALKLKHDYQNGTVSKEEYDTSCEEYRNWIQEDYIDR